MGAIIAPQSTNQPKIERYERLITLYTQLIEELDDLHKEGLVLKSEVQKAVDQQKMAAILKTIKQST